MPSIVHFLAAVHAIGLTLLATSPLSVLPVLATPLPMPFPMMVAYGDFISRSDLGDFNTTHPRRAAISQSQQNNAGAYYTRSSSASTAHARDTNTNMLLGNINVLNNYYNQMTQHSQNFQSLSQSSSGKSDDTNFQQQCSTELTGFQTNLFSFQSALKDFGSDKGLANYDRSNDLETLLKNVVNLNKDTLSAVDILVYQIPVLGGTLGPIVYEIKCILDEVLDAVENLTDAILNAVQPLLKGVISQATKTACNSGLQVAGLCLLLR